MGPTRPRRIREMVEAIYQKGSDVLEGWKEEVLSGTPPTLYEVGVGDLKRIEVGPGLVTLLGGAPGAGKTALVMQWGFDALRLRPSLRACVCNVEMSPGALLDRQLARLSGIPLTLIRHRKLKEEHGERIEAGLKTLEPLAERLVFVRPPFDLDNVAATVDAFEADLLVLDYIQRIPPGGDHGEGRAAVNATMSYLRQFADAGVAVLVVSAVGRSKDRRGRNSYSAEDLSLASFRESSELEFGADDAFILTPHRDGGGRVVLRHLKSRHGALRNITLGFDRRLQRFTPSENDPKGQQEETAAAGQPDEAREEGRA
jgi:replicative DNA helicase